MVAEPKNTFKRIERRIPELVPSMRIDLKHHLAAFIFVALSVLPVEAQERTDIERRGLWSRIFSRDNQTKNPGPGYNEKVHGVYMDRETDTVSALVREKPKNPEGRENDPVSRYPEIPGYLTVKNSSQKDIESLISKIYAAYEGRIDRMDPPDLRTSRTEAMGSVPGEFLTAWRGTVAQPVWHDQRTVEHSVEGIYQRALQHSNQIKIYSDLPLIRETGMQEADGEFDINSFIDGRLIRTDEPIGSTLTTGTPANRFLENRDYIEAGVRKKFATGAEATLSNRLSTVNNNSTFLAPQNQGASELVLSVVQPLLEGGGYHYNQSKIKLAKFDSQMASAEFVRQLQSHLIEVNRAYWALFYARSYFILTKELVSDTSGILSKLEQRSDLDALQSEVLRARSSLAMRKSMLNRAEMAVRNSEERLRALVNDPGEDIGSNAEMIPVTPPVLSGFMEDVRKVASDALRNRPEISQGFDALRAAIVRRDIQKNQKWPTLNLVAELMLGDIEPRERVGSAFEDQFGDGTGYMVGFQFSQPWDNDTDRAQLLRSELELRQQTNQLRAAIDLVLLDALVSYRELMTAYRDMQGRFAALKASREELRQLRDRLEVDTEEDAGRTTASQLQLILDSMDRNQSAEEMFLESVVSYNASFASLQRARGTFLRSENVKIDRVRDTDPAHPNQEVERLDITKPGFSSKDIGTYSEFSIENPTYTPIPDVPPLSSTHSRTFDLPSREREPEKEVKKGMFSRTTKKESTQAEIAMREEADRSMMANSADKFASASSKPSGSGATFSSTTTIQTEPGSTGESSGALQDQALAGTDSASSSTQTPEPAPVPSAAARPTAAAKPSASARPSAAARPVPN